MGTYFRELDARYPGSKFILTERPLEPWVTSVGAQFIAAPNPGDPFRRDVRMATFGVSTFHEGRFRRVHQDHAAGVRAHFAGRPEALLIQNYFAGDGWETLCAFLGRPVPQVPFPNVNTGAQGGAGQAYLVKPAGQARAKTAAWAARSACWRASIASKPATEKSRSGSTVRAWAASARSGRKSSPAASSRAA